MTTLYIYNTFASTYGSGQYDANNYNGTATSGTGADGSGSSTLSNTGVMIGLIVGAAAAILLIAMIVRIWKRPKRAAKTE
jgi:hypothetical protein